MSTHPGVTPSEGSSYERFVITRTISPEGTTLTVRLLAEHLMRGRPTTGHLCK